MENIRIPAWLIAICAFVFMGVLLEQLYVSKRPVDLWGLKLNQPTSLPQSVFQSGSITIGQDDSGWTLASDKSPSREKVNTRTYTMFVPFREKLDRAPNVHVSISYIDATPGGNSPTDNVRASIKVVDRNESGFKVLISTWDASKLWGIGISWIAYVPEIK